jgi:hypothetical protein
MRFIARVANSRGRQVFHKKRGNMLCSALEHSWLGYRSKPDKPLDADRQVDVWSDFGPSRIMPSPAHSVLQSASSKPQSAADLVNSANVASSFALCCFRLNWHQIDGDAADTAKRQRLHRRMPSDGEGAARLGGTAVEQWIATSSEFRSPTTRRTQAAILSRLSSRRLLFWTHCCQLATSESDARS